MIPNFSFHVVICVDRGTLIHYIWYSC